jgi:hypothetical protein
MHRLALLLSIMALPLILTAMATANSQTMTIVTLHETDPFPAATAACGFPIDLREDGSFKVTDFFDNSGTLFKEIVTAFGGPFTVTAINPANGKSTTTQSETEVTIATFNPDGSLASFQDSGVIFNFHVQGQGTILQAIGHRVFDPQTGVPIFIAGPHDFHDQNTAAFCSYMADP